MTERTTNTTPQTFKINVDPVALKAKPAVFDGRLRNRLCAADKVRSVTLDEFIKLVTSGHSFTAGVMTGTTGDTWQSQQIICADIDNAEDLRDEKGEIVTDKNGKRISVMINNPLQPAEACEIIHQHFNCSPAFVYYSFSNKPNWPKFRVVMLLSEPLTDGDKAIEYTKRFAAIFNKDHPKCADTKIKDNARLYYGTTSDGLYFACDEEDLNSCMATAAQFEQLPPVEEAKPEKKKTTEPTTAPAPVKPERIPSASDATLYDRLQAQFEYDKSTFDLMGYVDQTEPGQVVRRGNVYFFNPCPLCGHNDDFQVTGAVFHAFGAGDQLPNGDDKAGTIIDYLMYRHELKYGEACDKFKYEIMGYDRDEWRRAWREAEEDNRKFAAEIGFDTIKDNSSSSDENAPQIANNEPAGATDAEGQYIPAGILTYEKALAIFETANDEFVTMPKFPEFCKRAKIKLHDSVVLAADTGAGKSSLAINFIDNLNDDYPVMYFNLEMDELTILRRLVSIRTGIELDRIEGYKHDERTAAAVNTALREITSRKPLQIIQDKYNIKDIEAEIKQTTAGRDDPTIVVIDHSLLVTTKESYSRYERFTQISEELRRISRLNNVIMFVLLQQNREGKADENKRPTNASLKESGSWENDATHILFLWYDPQARTKKIIMTKNRSGAPGEFSLEYYPTTQYYKESRDQIDNTGTATNARQNKRNRERDQLQAWYEEAYTATGGNVTLYDMAEAAGTTTAVIKRRLKEYGGYIVEGEQYDAAGMDTDVEQAQFIRMTIGEAPAFDDDPKPATPQKRY